MSTPNNQCTGDDCYIQELKELLGINDIVSDRHYLFTQSIPSDTWVIEHNLGKYPNVTIIDSAGTVVEGSVRYIDENTVDRDWETSNVYHLQYH